MNVSRLHQAIAGVCPITGVSVRIVTDKSTWEVFHDAVATEEQRTAAAAVVAAFDPDAPSPATELLPQDLIAQFNASDAAAIRAAVEENAQFWLLWSAMQAQKDPMNISNDRFLQGWNALMSVLGPERMSQIAAALNVAIS